MELGRELYHGKVELTPVFISRLLESVAHSGVDRHTDEAPTVPEVRRLPLFRQSRHAPSPMDLVEDCRRLCRSRQASLILENGDSVDSDRIAKLERVFQSRSGAYVPGHFLSLVRLALDIGDTERSGLTVLESRSLHLLERRLFEQQRSERPPPPAAVAGWLAEFHSGDPWRLRGLADLLRYLDEVMGHPFLGHPDQVTSDGLQLLLGLHQAHLSLSPKQTGPLGRVPLDVCLAARAVLANSRVLHLRMGALLDRILSPEMPLWVDLGEWVQDLSHQRDATFQLPTGEAVPDFLVETRRLRALDLVVTVAERLHRTVRALSIDDSLVALERTLQRRIHRQEARKRHIAILLRRVIDRALHEKHRRSMRLASFRHSAEGPAPVVAISGTESPEWERLLDLGRSLEEARAWGCSLSAGSAWKLLFPGETPRSEELADLEEFLRYAMDERGDLAGALGTRDGASHSILAAWYVALSVRAGAMPAEPSRGTRRRKPRVTPLQWLATAQSLRAGLAGGEAVFRDVASLDAELDASVALRLETWSQRHPWDRGLFGIWSIELKGPLAAGTLTAGILAARGMGVSSWEVDVRLGMLGRELEYRSWLGARERVHLLVRTVESGLNRFG